MLSPDQPSSASLPSEEELAAERARKYAFVPITEEWVQAREAWFTDEMVRIQNSVQASQVDALDNETLESMIDFSTAPVSPDLDAFLGEQAVQAAGGSVGDGENEVDLDVVDDGDLLFGYNPGRRFGSVVVPISAWGLWRHMAIIQGRNMVHAPNPGVPALSV